MSEETEMGSEILMEWTAYGGALHVRAVDAADGLEVAFMVPARVSEKEIQSLAVAKLRFVRQRQSRDNPVDRTDKGPGLVV